MHRGQEEQHNLNLNFAGMELVRPSTHLCLKSQLLLRVKLRHRRATILIGRYSQAERNSWGVGTLVNVAFSDIQVALVPADPRLRRNSASFGDFKPGGLESAISKLSSLDCLLVWSSRQRLSGALSLRTPNASATSHYLFCFTTATQFPRRPSVSQRRTKGRSICRNLQATAFWPVP